jgi:hypothetical protein
MRSPTRRPRSDRTATRQCVRTDTPPMRGNGLPPPAKPEPHVSTTSLEPFELSFDRAQAFYALKLDFTVRSPELPNFQRGFSVGRLQLTRIALKDGDRARSPHGCGDLDVHAHLGQGARIRWRSARRGARHLGVVPRRFEGEAGRSPLAGGHPHRSLPDRPRDRPSRRPHGRPAGAAGGDPPSPSPRGVAAA